MKRALKIGAAVLATVLIAVLLSIINALYGNPISSHIAKGEIVRYANKTYPNMDYTMTDVSYNYKFGEYDTFIQSQASEDTKFRVAYKKGEITDYYEYEVQNKFTTFRRLDENFSKVIKDIIKNEYPYEASGYFGTLNSDERHDILELDMIFDPYNLPLPAAVVIWTESERVDYDVLAERLLKLDEIISNRKIEIAEYTVYLQKPVVDTEEYRTAPSISVIEFPKEKINQDNLPQVLKEYVENWIKENDGRK